jgi:hypothetical protein
MWSLHPFINDEIMQQAWKYIHWTIFSFYWTESVTIWLD